ncbi:MAG: DNA polymerase I, partial [Rhodobacteraceae bacterium]|nr:DNA polymerase I [Paracoccaceae bacterium]
THVAVIFDHSSHSFRNDIFDGYKANRPPAPEDLVPQFPLTREATKAFNIACEEMEGFEADDMIATLACQARDAGGRVTIISSDKDLMQLVGDGIEMYDAMKNKRIDREGVFEKFGVYPDRVIDVQSLAGDSVDNVPGAPGIGVKTAAALINEFGDLDELLSRAVEIKQPKRRQTLLDHAEQIKLSRELVTLDCNTPLTFALEDLEFRAPIPGQLLDFLTKMEFRTLTKRIAQKFELEIPTSDNLDTTSTNNISEKIPFDSANYEYIKTADQLQTWVHKIYETGYVAIDTETTSLNDMLAELVGISLATEIGSACYIPIGHKEGQDDDLFDNFQLVEGQLDLEYVLDCLRPVLTDDSILKIGQNIKYDAKVLSRYGIEVTTFDDTMLLSYAMHGGLHNHGMDALSERYLDHSPISIKTLIGSGKSAITFDKVKIEDAVTYAAEDADITLRLWKIFKQKLHLSKVTKVYESLERPLVSVLAQMEKNGVKVDRETLSRMSNAFAQKMAGLEAEIYELAGETFNVGSPKQLGEIMFDKLGYEGGKKGKNGAYATGADILEELATSYDFPKRVLDWRQLSKLKSTYTDALQDHINPDTGRVHTSYSIAGAVTGRLSSTEPNLQNIPVRTEDGRRIREAFVAESGNILVSLDYSQIELRILAHIAKIDALKQAFHDGLDIHAMTASEMFDVPLDQMTPEIRRQAKAINFGVIYGISGFGLARNLRIPRAEAQGFIDRYFDRFPGIKEYMDETIKFSKENNYVKTLFGRVIHTPEINAKGPMAGFAKRAAINAPIQGTAADIIRRAMIRVPDAIKDLPAKMLLQVHDELLFEVKEEFSQDLVDKVQSIMETASLPFLKMDIPLSVDAGHGLNWAEAH